MRRREFIGGLGSGAVIWPLAARAQQPPARIGFFTPQSPNPPWIEAFRAGMREHGYLEGAQPHHCAAIGGREEGTLC
jgi:hypothetical protein